MASILGVVFIILFALSFQAARQRSLFTIQSGALVAIIGHFYLLGAWGACITNALSLCRTLSAAYLSSGGRNAIFLVLVPISLIAIEWTAASAVHAGILAAIAMSCLYASWTQNILGTRLCYLVASALWLVFGTMTGAWVLLISEILNGASILLALWYYHIPTNLMAPPYNKV